MRLENRTDQEIRKSRMEIEEVYWGLVCLAMEAAVGTGDGRVPRWSGQP